MYKIRVDRAREFKAARNSIPFTTTCATKRNKTCTLCGQSSDTRTWARYDYYNSGETRLRYPTGKRCSNCDLYVSIASINRRHQWEHCKSAKCRRWPMAILYEMKASLHGSRFLLNQGSQKKCSDASRQASMFGFLGRQNLWFFPWFFLSGVKTHRPSVSPEEVTNGDWLLAKTSFNLKGLGKTTEECCAFTDAAYFGCFSGCWVKLVGGFVDFWHFLF